MERLKATLKKELSGLYSEGVDLLLKETKKHDSKKGKDDGKGELRIQFTYQS